MKEKQKVTVETEKLGEGSEPEGAPAASKPSAEPPKEVGGRGGLEPTRYGDWEVKGVATDF